MELKITGDLRTVANSAWISTTDEIKAMERTDEDARRVVSFLAENHHTSPFEHVTLTFRFADPNMWSWDLKPYWEDNYGRCINIAGEYLVTIDLLNFIKITMQQSLFEGIAWREFIKQRPNLAEVCQEFRPVTSKDQYNYNVLEILGEDNNMTVDLINVHDVGLQSHNRATWRIKCPLSIAVQLLRHRKSSPNMVSGRYRTIKQEMVFAPEDCRDIFGKVGVNLDEYLGLINPLIDKYLQTMKMAQAAKKEKKISNSQYKRLREFARFILPEGRMTELYLTMYLDDFYNNYLPLRNSAEAQIEHIFIAQEMQRTLEQE